MFERLKSLFSPPRPAGPPDLLVSFSPQDATISQEVVVPEGEGWRVACTESQTVRLFEVRDPDAERCILTFRANIKGQGISQRAYLEMWCRFPGQGEFFSRGLENVVRGTSDWASYETSFFLKKAQRPDLLKLNLEVEGPGTAWLKEVQLLKTPLA